MVEVSEGLLSGGCLLCLGFVGLIGFYRGLEVFRDMAQGA